MANICAGVISGYMEFTLANWNLKMHLSTSDWCINKAKNTRTYVCFVL